MKGQAFNTLPHLILWQPLKGNPVYPYIKPVSILCADLQMTLIHSHLSSYVSQLDTAVWLFFGISSSEINTKL